MGADDSRLEYVAQQTVTVGRDDRAVLERLVERLEENEDVTAVTHNASAEPIA
jgi:transcriptional/translational regulatory protein YebC/TACO1